MVSASPVRRTEQAFQPPICTQAQFREGGPVPGSDSLAYIPTAGRRRVNRQQLPLSNPPSILPPSALPVQSLLLPKFTPVLAKIFILLFQIFFTNIAPYTQTCKHACMLTHTNMSASPDILNSIFSLSHVDKRTLSHTNCLSLSHFLSCTNTPSASSLKL